MKRLLCVLVAVAMTMLFNPVQAEDTDITSAAEWAAWTGGGTGTLKNDITLTGNANWSSSTILDGKNYTVTGSGNYAVRIDCKNSTFVFKDVNFAKCSSDIDQGGGAIRDSVSIPTYNEIQLSGDITFSYNSSICTGDGGGGAIYTNGKLTTNGLTSLTCDHNTADSDGGAFAVWGSGGINISNVTGEVKFTNNSATRYPGGAIVTQAPVVFKNNSTVTFSGNTDSTGANDIYTYGAGVTLQGGTYSFDGGIVTVYNSTKGNIEISPYTDGTTTNPTTVTFDCDLAAGTVSIQDSTVTFGEVSEDTNELVPTPQVAAAALASPAIMAASTVLSEPTTDLEIPADLKSTNTQINNTALTLSAGSTTNTVNGDLTISGNSTVTAQDLVVTGKLTNGTGSTLTYTSLNVGSLEIDSDQTMSTENLTISTSGDLTMNEDSVLNMSYLETLTVDTATLAGTINIGGNGSEVTDKTLLTAGTSLNYTGLELNYTGSGNFDLSWDVSEDGNSLLYTLKSKGGTESVPEPSTWALLILGCAGLMWYRRKK